MITSKYGECTQHEWTWELGNMGCPICVGITIENTRLLASFRLWCLTHLNLEEAPRVVAPLDDFNLFISSLEIKPESKTNE